MKALVQGIARFIRDEEGVTMVEYGLLAALIAVVCIIAVTGVGVNLKAVYSYICTKLGAAPASGGGTCS